MGIPKEQWSWLSYLQTGLCQNCPKYINSNKKKPVNIIVKKHELKKTNVVTDSPNPTRILSRGEIYRVHCWWVKHWFFQEKKIYTQKLHTYTFKKLFSACLLFAKKSHQSHIHVTLHFWLLHSSLCSPSKSWVHEHSGKFLSILPCTLQSTPPTSAPSGFHSDSSILGGATFPERRIQYFPFWRNSYLNFSNTFSIIFFSSPSIIFQ